MATYLIGGAIAVYAIYIAQKKMKDWRRGIFCGCGCQSCAGKSGCNHFSGKESHQKDNRVMEES